MNARRQRVVVRGETVIYRNVDIGAEIQRGFEFPEPGALVFDGRLRFLRVEAR